MIIFQMPDIYQRIMNDKLNQILANRILFAGGYGEKNTGDDAFAVISAWGAKRFWNTKNISFLERHLPTLTVEAKSVLSKRPLNRYHYLSQIFFRIATTPALIFSGGSVFVQESGRLWKSCMYFSKIKKLTVGAIGVSLGPYKSKQARSDIENLLKHFSFLVLRDRRSYKQALAMDLPYDPIEGFDMAALLGDVYGLPTPVEGTLRQNGKKILGVSICHYERYVGGDLENEMRRENFLLDVLKQTAKSYDVDFKFFVFNGHQRFGESELIRQFASQLSGYSNVKVIPYTTDPLVMWNEVGSCSGVLATRLHAGIFSCFAKIPFLQVEYHRKCADFLDDISYPSDLRMGDAELSVDGTTTLIADILSGRKKLEIDVESLKQKAERNFKLS